MNIAIALFCFLVAGLTSLKYWLDQSTKKYKVSATTLAFLSSIPAYFVLVDIFPVPAAPVINNASFYAQGNPGDFQYCFEFYARNDGETLCELEKVEFLLNDVVFATKNSALLYVGKGGGGGGRLGGSANVMNEVVSAIFPQTIPSTNHLFHIVGKGLSANKNSNEELFINPNTNVHINVIFYFRSKNMKLSPVELNVPVISRQINNMR